MVKFGPVNPLSFLVSADVSDIFYFCLRGEGGRGSPSLPGGGGGVFFIENPRGGGCIARCSAIA